MVAISGSRGKGLFSVGVGVLRTLKRDCACNFDRGSEEAENSALFDLVGHSG